MRFVAPWVGRSCSEACASTLLDARSSSSYIDAMDDLLATRELLSRQLVEAIATDPIGVLPTIVALQKDADAHLREAVRGAARSSSWRAIADALGVSKQAAHQRFRDYAKEVAREMKTEHRAMKQAQHSGRGDDATQARDRRDELADQLRTAARSLKNEASRP